MVAAVTLALLVSCRKNDAAGNVDPNAVNLYSCNAIPSNLAAPYICFDSLIADCRCPEDVECIWSGYAMIKTTFHENGNTHSFRMIIPNLKNFGAVNDTAINGYRIVFKDLVPYPNTQKPVPSASDIKATVEISK